LGYETKDTIAIEYKVEAENLDELMEKWREVFIAICGKENVSNNKTPYLRLEL
jgi:hypothetical protein